MKPIKTKNMKKIILIIAAVCVMSMNYGCATIFTGTSPEKHCKIKPAAGQPQREIRMGALVCDILFGGLWTIVDFVDGAIYKPCAK